VVQNVVVIRSDEAGCIGTQVAEVNTRTIDIVVLQTDDILDLE
jgi:hypothetical protein